MKTVITYGTYDLLHYGHIRLLERAKELGDYLIVGVTADDFDTTRGKINVKQSLMERIEGVKATGIADKIIVEEYEGQKIDDIQKYDVDIFTVGSDWIGKFDYLKDYCEVVYLERTQGVSSSSIRSEQRNIKLGLLGESGVLKKYYRECSYVNGVEISAIYTEDKDMQQLFKKENLKITESKEELFAESDAVYIASHPSEHYKYIKEALLSGKHVLCEAPLTLKRCECEELFELASEKKLVLMEAIKTAYSTAYRRLLLLAIGGKIGDIVSVDCCCTSLKDLEGKNKEEQITTSWNSITAWGTTALLPVFQLLGVDYKDLTITSKFIDYESKFDGFTKLDFIYQNAVASVIVGKSVKSEGHLVISGTKGYIYVPAPWWKTDYFEIRYEDQTDNKRYFYQLDGEGIRYELVAFVKSIENSCINNVYMSNTVSKEIATVMERFYDGKVNVIL